MPAPKILLSDALSAGDAYRLTPNAPGDFGLVPADAPSPAWAAAVGDLNGDGLADLLIGAAADDDKNTDAGRVFIHMGQSTGGTSTVLTTDVSDVIIDGVMAGDQAGAAVAGIGDLNGNGIGELLIGAPGMDVGAAADAGVAFVLWNPAPGAGIDLGDPFNGDGKGYALKGAAAGDAAGSAVASIADQNGDGRAEVLVGAPGVDGPLGADQGAVYVAFGKAGNAALDLGSVAAGTGGFRILGESAGDAIGRVIGSLADQNGDGRAEILIGAPLHGAAGEGAAYVVFGQSAGTEVSLAQVAAGIGGYRIMGAAGDAAGAALGAIGDVNADGRADLLLGAPGSDRAYVVFGQSGTSGIDLAALGAGGYRIRAEAAGDLAGLSVAGGADLNRDGVADLLIGAPNNSEGGWDAGAVYAVWGGGSADIDLAQVAQGIGGAKIVGAAGSRLGSTVSLSPDLNGDATADLVLGAPGSGESVYTLFTPADWRPDANVYGSFGDDVIGPGYASGSFVVGEGADVISALDGQDWVNAAGGHDEVDGGAGNDTLLGGAGDDRLDGGTGSDRMEGGSGDDTFIVDDAGDAVVELAGEGSDRVLALVNWTLPDGVERLELGEGVIAGTGSGEANTLVGNALDNALAGAGGADSLEGGDGHDTLDGGSGADTMAGGAGDDTYLIDDLGDVVIEADGGGTDTVVVSVDLPLPAFVENVRLAGSTAGGSVSGNAGNNTVSGNGGDNVMDGGAGDDLLLAGDGDDVLIASAGIDTLSGGSGDDVYKVHGSTAHIEDFLGHDTLDASEATGDSHIDLSGSTPSRIEDHDCDFGQGGTTASPLDVQFLQDLSGSFGDDIAMVQGLIPQIVGALHAVQANSLFGVSSFIDKPVSPFGDVGEWVYQQELVLTSNQALLSDTYNNLVIRFGNDEPEAQIEGLMQLALHAADVGFRPDSARFVVLFTDAPYHVAGDGVQGGITTPNNGDAVADGAGAGEDYPFVPQVQAALQAANIIPIFAIANNYESFYTTLVTELGRGAVVTLTADSSNVVSAITAGLTAATTTRIEDAIGGAGNDWLQGDATANRLVGGAGRDSLLGGVGDDRLEGGVGDDALQGDAGDDLAVIAGTRAGHAVTQDALTGAVTIRDLNTGPGGSGIDTLGEVERVQFDDGVFTIADLLSTATPNQAPVGAPTTVLPDGTEDQPFTVSTAELLAGFSDPDGDALQVSGLVSSSGSVADLGDGRFTITPAANAHGPVTLQYAVIDGRGGSVASSLGFNLAAVNDAPAGTPTAVLPGGSEDQPWIADAPLLLQGLSDVDGDALSIVSVSSDHGSASVGADGRVTVTPQADYHGAVALSYTVSDGQGGTLPASQGFVLAPVNDAPQVVGVQPVLPAGEEDQAFAVAPSVLLSAWGDVDGDALAVSGLTASHASVAFDAAAGVYRITPEVNYAGPSTLSYAVSDGSLSVATALDLSFLPVNDAPTGSATAVLPGGTQGSAYAIASAALLQGFSDVDGDVLSVANLVSSVGSITAQPDGSFTLNPGPTASGPVSLSYEVVDGQGGRIAATQAFTLAALQPLLADADALLVTRGKASALDAGVLLVNDSAAPGVVLTVSAVGNAIGATVALVGGQLVITASAAAGSFDYTLSGSTGGSSIGHVSFTAATTNTAANAVAAAAGMAAADLQGQGGNDTLSGSAGADRLDGGTGNDQLFGQDGPDLLLGGDGTDRLDGGAGIDTLVGGLGNDTYLVGDAADVITEAAGGGTDTVSTPLASYTLDAELENLQFTGSGAFTGIGNGLANSLTGGAGDDWLDGAAGADRMNGGLGNDTYGVDAAADAITDSGGIDTVRTSLPAYTLGSALENLVYTGSGAFTGTGSSGDNQIVGGAGADSLNGGKGNDLLDGGAGWDVLTGGTGADVFRFDALGDLGLAAGATDRITDFKSSQLDRIDLSLIDADTTTAGDQAFSYLGKVAFTHHAGELIAAVSGASLMLYGDVNGDGVADLALQLAGVTSVVAADFLL